MISVLTTVFEDLLSGEQVDVLSTVYKDLLRGEQVDGQTAVHEGLLIVGQAVVQQAVHGCLHVHAHDRGQDVRGFAQWWADRCQQRRRTLRESESNDV